MRKVQEVIGRFGRKSSPGVALLSQLEVPAQQAAGVTLTPIDPDGLKSWLLTNGAFNSSSRLQPLIDALRHCNRSDISPADRLLGLSHFEASCMHALQTLDTRYLYLDFPLPDDAEEAFHLATELCNEMAFGYKLALSGTNQNHKWLDKKSRSQVIGQALKHLSRLALRHTQVYRQWPEPVWQDATTLMRLALLDKTHTLETTLKEKNKEKKEAKGQAVPRIVDQYARLCLLQILDCKQYSADSLQTLYTRLARHEIIFDTHPISNTPVSVKSDTGSQTIDAHYCVTALNPPVHTHGKTFSSKDMPLYFSVVSLHQENQKNLDAENINTLLYKFKTQQNTKDLCTSTASMDLQTPDRQNTGTETGTPNSREITAESSLKEIHALLHITPSTNYSTSAADAKHKKDIFNQPTEQEFGGEFEVCLQNKGGFSLKWSGVGNCRTQVGELIAHSYGKHSGDINWHVGLIEWLEMADAEKLKLGVKTIADNASAVSVFRLTKGRERTTAPLGGLLAQHSDTELSTPVLILPQSKFKPGETVGLRDMRGFNLVKLLETMGQNYNFQCFAISQADSAIKPVIEADNIEPVTAATAII